MTPIVPPAWLILPLSNRPIWARGGPAFEEPLDRCFGQVLPRSISANLGQLVVPTLAEPGRGSQKSGTHARHMSGAHPEHALRAGARAMPSSLGLAGPRPARPRLSSLVLACTGLAWTLVALPGLASGLARPRVPSRCLDSPRLALLQIDRLRLPPQGHTRMAQGARRRARACARAHTHALAHMSAHQRAPAIAGAELLCPANGWGSQARTCAPVRACVRARARQCPPASALRHTSQQLDHLQRRRPRRPNLVPIPRPTCPRVDQSWRYSTNSAQPRPGSAGIWPKCWGHSLARFRPR